jgi:NAD(P)H dehydrogenase (quinone)
MILITGAAGRTGMAVLAALKARGAAVRCFCSNRNSAARLHSIGADETIVGDLADGAALRRAAAGVRAVYHIAPNMSEQEIAMGKAAIAAAQAASVGRFVYHSVIFPYLRALPHHWDKLAVEELLIEERVPYTILQPTMYMQNIAVPEIAKAGVFAQPYSADRPMGLVDLDDVAAVAAAALLDASHIGATYELCSGESLTRREMAVIMSAVLGRPVETAVVDVADWQAHNAPALSGKRRERLFKMFRHYDAAGLPPGNPNILRWLLGRAPTSFAAFVKRAAAANAASPATEK